MDLDILLHRPDGTRLLDGLDTNSLAFVDRLATIRPASTTRFHDEDPNAMDQGWGVLYPADQPELLDAIAELRSWRREAIAAAAEAGKRGVVPAIVEWAIERERTVQDFLRDYRGLLAPQRPRYLLILGDFDRVDFEFQRALGREAYVGRLCLPTLADYEAYARKLVRCEREHEREGPPPRLVLMSTSSASHPDLAVDSGHANLIEPIVEDFHDPQLGQTSTPVQVLGPRGDFAQAVDWPGVRLELAAARPAVLLSLANGLGDPNWSAHEQREHQGQLSLGGSERLSHADVRDAPFLPGGVWFNYACFSGGTPERSAFEPWLRLLVGAEARFGIPDVLRTLARGDAFVARQAQLALANPRGPVAVIGHNDLAFTYSFIRHRGQEQRRRDGRSRRGRRRPSHEAILGVLHSLAGGRRTGVALSRLRAPLTEAEQILLGYWQRAETNKLELLRLLDTARRETRDATKLELGADLRAAVERVRDAHGQDGVTLERVADQAGRSPTELLAALGQALDQTSQAHVGHNWMARHDLGGWFVLGDPAAHVARLPAPIPTPTPGSTPAPDLAKLEEAVAAYAYFVVARGERSAADVAQSYGLDADDLQRHYARWSRAGRRGLGNSSA